jgi:hypothetical protein
VLADGAWHEAARPIRVGDRAVPQAGLMSHDATTAWIAEHKDVRHGMREVSASGEPGRVSWPSWLEAGLAPEWHIDGALSYVLPAPHGLARSPLGLKDGLVGARVVYQGAAPQHKTARELTTIDGRTWTGPPGLDIGGLIELPSGESRPVLAETAWRAGTTVSLWNREGTVRGASFGPKDARYWRGSVAPYPDGLWHALTARDAPGSTRLRAITDEDARALIDALAGVAELAELVPVDVVATRLPAVTDERLRRGIAGVVALAAELQRTRDALRDDRAPGKATVRAAASGPDDAAILAALGGWVDRKYDDGAAVLQVAACGELFRSDDRRDRSLLDTPGSQVEWLPLAIAPGALVFLAGAIGISAEHRRTIAGLVAVIARALPDPAKLRVWSGVRTITAEDAEEAKCKLSLHWHGGNAYALSKQGWGNEVRVLEYAPDGVFKPLPRIALVHATRGVAAVPADVLAAVEATAGSPGIRSASVAASAGSSPVIPVAGLQSAGSSPGHASAAAASAGSSVGHASAAVGSLLDDAAALVAATGLTPSEAVYLVAGCPGAGTRVSNFLDKELRERLGLKAAQTVVARDALAAIPRSKRLAALDEAGRDGDLAQAWIRHVGKRVAIPEELIADADRELLAPIPPSQALPMFGSAAEAPPLTIDARWAVTLDGGVTQVGQPGAAVSVGPSGAASSVGQSAPVAGQSGAEDGGAFALPVLRTACQYLPFLFAELPVGHPLRAQAAVAYGLVLARLNNPSLLFEIENVYVSEEQRAGVDSLLTALGGEPISGLAEGCTGRLVPGALIVRQVWTVGAPPRENMRLKIQLRPATLDARAVPTVEKLVALASVWSHTPWLLVRYIQSADLADMMARIEDTPVPAGGWEQHPAASVPRLVDKVAARLDVSKDAAGLYLQYLALLWPTPKNLAMWNGWHAKRLAAANAELESRELILEAKRERAQRPYFLPGGWEALKSPHPPMESWKLPLYGRRTVEGAAVPAMVRFAALAPFHLMFERAWQRIEAGDVPKYDEVKR